MPSSAVQKCADRKSTRLNSSHGSISYAVFCLKKKIVAETVVGSVLVRSFSFAGHEEAGVKMFFVFFNDTATTEIYTLSLHDALPISLRVSAVGEGLERANARGKARY